MVLLLARGEDAERVSSMQLGPDMNVSPAMLSFLRREATSHWQHLGLEFHAGRTRYEDLSGSPLTPFWLVIVPYSLLVGVCTTAALVLGAAAFRFRRRTRSGCCPACGYNLTGNTSGICPECGTPVPPGSEP